MDWGDFQLPEIPDPLYVQNWRFDLRIKLIRGNHVYCRPLFSRQHEAMRDRQAQTHSYPRHSEYHIRFTLSERTEKFAPFGIYFQNRDNPESIRSETVSSSASQKEGIQQ